MDSRPDLARALAHAARQIHTAHDLKTTTMTIVETAQRSLPGIDHVGISITHRDGRIGTVAATDRLVLALDGLQYELGEGPCLDAIRKSGVVKVDHVERQQERWPRYAPRAAALGLRAQMGVRLYLEDQTLGGLNVYSTQTGILDPDLLQAAELFATHAALAMGRVRHEENLNSALHTRKVIGQAIGILMERYELDEDRAFQYLTRVSQHSNIKLRDVAVELVQLSNERNRLPDGAIDGAPRRAGAGPAQHAEADGMG